MEDKLNFDKKESFIYKIRLELVILLIAFIVTTIGALAKLEHWPIAKILLTVGTAIKVVAFVLIIRKVIIEKKYI
jgi:hypothetical protein